MEFCELQKNFDDLKKKKLHEKYVLRPIVY